jgi:DNA-binding MarR family transcriptional regulator
MTGEIGLADWNLAKLLRVPFQALVEELHRRLAEQGFGDIRPTHTIIFALVDAEGIRLRDLAERAQLTKQLVNYLVGAIEELGYIERVPDPIDGRGKLVRLTPRGIEASAAGSAILRDLEREWAEQLDEPARSMLRPVLEQLARLVTD